MDSKKRSPHTIGLALSGGGYRAAAFHLGTMRKLNEMHLLDKVEVFSTVSGGSIVGADFVLQVNNISDYKTFEENHIKKLKQSVIGQVLSSRTFIAILISILAWLAAITYFQLTCFPWISFVILVAGIYFLIANQFKIFPVSKIIEKIYNGIFFSGKTLSNLPEKPVIVINSTNLETGRQFTFSKNRMGDSTYDFPETGEPIKFNGDSFPIARGVMASSCVPFAFTPISIDTMYYVKKEDISRAKPELVDGGVFDNQGVHKLTHEKSGYECDIVIVSDAGNKMGEESSFKNVITLLIRCMDLFRNRIKKFEMTDNIYNNLVLKQKEIAYISLGWDLEKCVSGYVGNLKKGLVLPEVVAAHKIPSEFLNPFDADKIQKHLEDATSFQKLLKQKDGKTSIARGVGTNLTALPDEQINALINHAELMTELQVKLYCPSLINPK